ncbi:uncharacterized protein LOC131619424 [Vicia villosa]|uniref:uncharacterized protein LOC131619424 n=1 Tax=Vicia villosa TaxID=3911 RepID=UPI00273CCF8D|nr:uncharacterized protein LOC131619424 [Vicia villosa]
MRLRASLLHRSLNVGSVLAMTATATTTTLDSIMPALDIPFSNLIQNAHLRDNLCLSVSLIENRIKYLLVLIKSPPFTEVKSIIVYYKFQSETDQISRYLNDNNISAKSYHSGIFAKDLVKKYHMNTFVFTSIPDFWSMDHLFPIFPILRLDGKPTVRGILSNLTCDSDGKIDKFISGESSFPLHELEGLGIGYYLGMFLGRAYEEALGGLHNLFGGPSVVKLLQSDSPQAVAGPSYANVVRVMHHELQLMFNVADKWMLNEGLPISFREQVVQFICQNSGQKDITFDASFCDPYTDYIAYVPGTHSRTSNISAKPTFKHIPKKGMLVLDIAQFDGIPKKVVEFNNALLSDQEKQKLSLAELDVYRLDDIVKTLKDTSHYHASKFPVSDIVRMLVDHLEGVVALHKHLEFLQTLSVFYYRYIYILKVFLFLVWDPGKSNVATTIMQFKCYFTTLRTRLF